jgi:hypothetical protein
VAVVGPTEAEEAGGKAPQILAQVSGWSEHKTVEVLFDFKDIPLPAEAIHRSSHTLCIRQMDRDRIFVAPLSDVRASFWSEGRMALVSETAPPFA